MSHAAVTVLAAIFVLFSSVSAAQAQKGFDGVYGKGTQEFSLATGSPGELGLVEALGTRFAAKTDSKLLWKKAGSGDSLKALKEKSVDMIMVHAPAGEKQAVSEGWAIKRTLLGSNEFFIVGPPGDPAKISEAKSAADAYKRIAGSKSKFLSRGDNSGTHKKEMDIWKKAEINPSGDWYIISRDFMAATLKRAETEKGYFMTDSSTWAAEGKKVPGLKILFKGDKVLVNTYHALCQPEGATPGAALAAKFIDFVASDEGQKIIREFGREAHGEALYNDAEYAARYE
ncbi:MAG: substrate-binding domain-containing protein [Desulfobacteraceae bacterium]|nr:substrate-binding domain-containing protein [Desulfobacteraceae bacterium]